MNRLQRQMRAVWASAIALIISATVTVVVGLTATQGEWGFPVAALVVCWALCAAFLVVVSRVGK